MSFPAFFDTNVLYGALFNDFILELADRGLFRPLWSKTVFIPTTLDGGDGVDVGCEGLPVELEIHVPFHDRDAQHVATLYSG